MNKKRLASEEIERRQKRLREWGLKKNPFSIRPPALQLLNEIFTNREKEMRSIIPTLYELPRNALVYGAYGIGKTTFVIETLRELSTLSKVLVAYAPLSGESPEDFERTVLLALANSLREKDKEAEKLLQALIGTEKSRIISKQFLGGVEGKLAVLDIKGGGTISISDTETKKIEGVRFYIQELLNKANKKYDRVIIAVDEIDKKEPDKAREIIVQCRDILHFDCSFILTGRLIGVPMDIHSSAFGAFDEKIWLEPLNDNDMRQIVINYLNSQRYKKFVDTKPFTDEAVQIIIEKSRGIPRVLNLTCFVLLNTAIELGVDKIDKDNLPKCLEIVSRKKYGDISPHIRYLIDIISKYGMISEEVPDELLREMGVRTFTELFPVLEALVRDDIIIKLENAKGMRYFLTPIISGMLKE